MAVWSQVTDYSLYACSVCDTAAPLQPFVALYKCYALLLHLSQQIRTGTSHNFAVILCVQLIFIIFNKRLHCVDMLDLFDQL